jgi:hypothetical protein
MKRLVPFILIFSILLSGCGALAAPAADATATISPEEIRATADAMVYDMLTQTAAVMPTNTPIPPTNTPLPPPTATITLIPTLSEDGAPTPISEATSVAVVPTNTKASTSQYPCTEKPLTGWTGESTQLTIRNYVPNSTANVFLCIDTPYDGSGYISVPVVNVSEVSVPFGSYFATAWVDGKKDFNASVGFEVKNTQNIQLVIENYSLYFKAGCAPGC